MIIDSHQHFWQRDLPFDYQWLEAPENRAINRDFLPSDLESQLQECGIDGSVFVQTQHNLAENDWALSLTEQHPFVLGVVGWVDLASPHCQGDLEQLLLHDRFVGIRHITQDEPDDDFIVREEILSGLKVLERLGVPFDLLFYAKHLKHAPTVATAVPELPLVIDHLSKPNIAAGWDPNWETEIREAAACDNVYCKLSGMITEANWENWSADDLRPYLETAIDAFGPKRCMYGSDWPVCELAGSYRDVWEAFGELIKGYSDSERAALLGETAQRFYGLTSADTESP